MVIEAVIILSLYTFDGGNKTIEGWYHQDSLSTCLAGKRTAERLVLELENKLTHFCNSQKEEENSMQADIIDEVKSALRNLDFKR